MFKAINFIRSQLTNYNTKSKKKQNFLTLMRFILRKLQMR